MGLTLPNTPILETERLLIRAPKASDLKPWMTFLMSDRGFWHGGGPEEGNGKAWRIVAIQMGHWQIHGYGTFVLERKSDGAPIGGIGPFFPDNWPEQEIGWAVWSPEDEGRGFASEASREIIRYCYADLGWDTCVSYIDARNGPSIALAERLGAVLDTKAARPDRADLVYRHPRPGGA